VAARASGPTAPYTVQKGDDLYSIARRHGTTVAALAQANGVADPNLILVGQVLSVPAAVVGSAAPATATAGTTAAKTAAVQKAATGATSHYVVRTGDTMEALARRYHTTVASLASASGIANPNQILPGQVVVVPAAPAASAAPSIAAPVAAAVVQAKVATPAPAPTVVAPTAPAPAPVVAAPKAAAPAPAPAPVTGLSALPLPAQYLHGGSVDQGVDYSAPGGTPLYAMGPGKIIRAGMSGFGPNCPVLEITAGPLAGKTVYYGHAGPNLVPVGATVAAGQQISIVGYGIVGYSTGPHLEVGFYPPGGNGAGGAMLQYINSVVGHSTAN
jgi:murein DD-endopeptidase MepM/ murein hydrolase activator NlpD